MCTSSSVGTSFLIMRGVVDLRRHPVINCPGLARFSLMGVVRQWRRKNELIVSAGLLRFFQQGFDGPRLSFGKAVSLEPSR